MASNLSSFSSILPDEKRTKPKGGEKTRMAEVPEKTVLQETPDILVCVISWLEKLHKHRGQWLFSGCHAEKSFGATLPIQVAGL